MRKERRSVMPFFVKLCSDKAAFEVKLQRKICFSMERLKQLFEATAEYELVVYTPHIIIAKRCNGAEITFSKNGRILIKKVLNKSEAEAIAEDVLNLAVKASIR